MESFEPKIVGFLCNWCSSCGDCEESIIDLAEDILKVTEGLLNMAEERSKICGLPIG